MRRRNWACCNNGVLRLISRLMPFLLVGCLFLANDVLAQAVMDLKEAEYSLSDASALPVSGLSWTRVTLPHRSARPTVQPLTGYWYRLNFDAPNAGEPLWLLFPKLRSGGTIYLNGQIGRAHV